MPLTVCIGSSGSGKTTFLNDVHKSHRCIYVRQYHNMRPFIAVNSIPNFDPSKLPFWDIYDREGTADKIKVGGTMAGKFTAGLSGGQRKLLLFELIFQRTYNQSELLIVLDEPFAGVTDDFVPFIQKRLEEMRQKHNILLVTNDHVATLTNMADNTLTVSAIDRMTVQLNDRPVKVDREKAIYALSVGDEYVYSASAADLKFFLDVEVYNSSDLIGIAVFTCFAFSLFLLTFWDSGEDSQALILIAGSLVSYFCVNPYLLSLVEWRNAMLEEADALVHSSKGVNKTLKALLTVLLTFIITLIEFGVVNGVVNGLSGVKFWVAMLFDQSSLTFPLICLGLFTALPFQAAQILGTLPLLLMIFLSTTYSPGAGVPVIKELRYMWSRFYFWCMVPSIQDEMEGCPAEDINILYLILASSLGLFCFLCVKTFLLFRSKSKKTQEAMKRRDMVDDEFIELQVELYGVKVLKRLKHQQSASSLRGSTSTGNLTHHVNEDDAATAV